MFLRHTYTYIKFHMQNVFQRSGNAVGLNWTSVDVSCHWLCILAWAVHYITYSGTNKPNIYIHSGKRPTSRYTHAPSINFYNCSESRRASAMNSRGGESDAYFNLLTLLNVNHAPQWLFMEYKVTGGARELYNGDRKMAV